MRGLEYRQARWEEPLLFELGNKGRSGYIVPDVEDEIREYLGVIEIPKDIFREALPNLPELSEVEVARHFLRLSQMSYGVDSGPIPLGSCTMKYNPKAMLKYVNDPRVALLHPLQDEETVQGLLEIMYYLQKWLANIVGMDVCTLHPAAGAQGELAGVLTIRRYHDLKKQDYKDEIIVPDSAHGTNPASASMAGFKVVEVPTAEDGNVDIEALESSMSKKTAGLMITNPSTLGLFEERILEIAKLIHGVDGLLYYDGANLNGIMGYARPGDMGFDIAHINIHKTFSSPHGGGGPGAGPVCIKDREVINGIKLSEVIPGPIVIKDRNGNYKIHMPKYAPGRLRAFFGNVGPLLWGFLYILALGPQGLKEATELAVLNTNYFIKFLKKLGVKGYELYYGTNRFRKHEVVLSAEPLKKETGVTAEDVAKGLLDRGFYAPTIYFPLIVPEALMIEFTDTETKENLERYAYALKEIEEEARKDPSKAKSRPFNTSVGRVDNVKANHPRTVTPTWRVKVLREKGLLSSLR
jgi:glycine dehydrogenase subunit 2